MSFANIRWIWLQAAVTAAALTVSTAGAKMTYRESVARGSATEAFFCDLDGDHLQDMVLISEPNLLLFYQDREKGFTEKPDQVCRLESKPALVWPARLGAQAESLLVMTSTGVTELNCADRNGPAQRRQIITQQTILPESGEGPAIARVPLSPQRKDKAPIILVPVGRDLQVWRRTDTWQCAATLKDALETTIWAAQKELGYHRMARLTLSLGDLTGDQRDDILVRTSLIPTCRYAVYAQNQDGLFGADPLFTWTGPWDWSWYAWVDINRDGHIDLIKSTALNESWLVPGMASPKVLVQIYSADEQGRIPAQPQQVFRKSDWIDWVPLLDVDGDGYLDLVLGYSAFDSREGLRKAFTAKQIDFALRLHFYRPGTGFAEKPDCAASVVLNMNHLNVDLSGYSRRRYFETYLSLQGDFDGDGRKDLLVRDRADRISVYPFVSRQAGFAKTAALWFDYADPIERLQVQDLNGDRHSDLILRSDKKDAFRVFISHDQ